MAASGELSTVTLQGPDGSSAVIHSQGATLTSWKTADGVERIFVSSKAKYAPGTAIRGGVPICWPQFGKKGPLAQQHGFARNSTWTLAHSSESTAVYRLSQADARLPEGWTQAFELEMEVALGKNVLTQELRVVNSGEQALEFTVALHTYFRVGDLAAAAVRGLRGLEYENNAAGGEVGLDDAPSVHFAGEVDRLYVQTPDELLLEGGAGGALRLAKRCFPDAVVWNPAAAKAAGMADLDDWRGFVCVEVAHAAGKPVRLDGGQAWAGRQILSAL